MQTGVIAAESQMDSASVSAALMAGLRARHCKIVLSEDRLSFSDFRDPIHRFPSSPRPTTKCARPRTATSVVNRFYDPATDQFISIDPDVADTNQPYVFTNDDPLNGEDPLGLCWPRWACGVENAVFGTGDHLGHIVAGVSIIVSVDSVVGIGAAGAAFLGPEAEAAYVQTIVASPAGVVIEGANAYGLGMILQGVTTSSAKSTSSSDTKADSAKSDKKTPTSSTKPKKVASK